jgi:hypothetical protein
MSKDPIWVGLDLLIFFADKASEDFVLLPFNSYSSISIWTDLMESEFMLPGISSRGIDALIPEAFGNCCSTRNSIFDEITFSVVSAPPHKISNVTTVTMRAADVLFI